MSPTQILARTRTPIQTQDLAQTVEARVQRGRGREQIPHLEEARSKESEKTQVPTAHLMATNAEREESQVKAQDSIAMNAKGGEAVQILHQMSHHQVVEDEEQTDEAHQPEESNIFKAYVK